VHFVIGPDAPGGFDQALRAQVSPGWREHKPCVPTTSPKQKASPVFPALKIGHEAIDYVWLRREEVHSIGLLLVRPAILDALDVCKCRQVQADTDR
jgi:hypothetical protein